jgi:hypothetical protein
MYALANDVVELNDKYNGWQTVVSGI